LKSSWRVTASLKVIGRGHYCGHRSESSTANCRGFIEGSDEASDVIHGELPWLH